MPPQNSQSPDDSTLKRCRDCGGQKPLGEFHRHADNRDGRASYCKPCVRERLRRSRASNPERQKINADRAYANLMADEERREHKRAMERKRYWERYRESRKAANRERYRRNPEPYKVRAKARNRNIDPADPTYTLILKFDPCCYCGERGNIEIDHIVPVSKGGGSEFLNLTAACSECNRSKTNGTLLSFLLKGATWKTRHTQTLTT
jgi:5-methylcytosine-specific restriction endonuclease McrA